MDAQTIDKLGRRLKTRLPLLGPTLRKSACRRLAAEPDAFGVAEYLIQVAESDDAELAEIAEAGLRNAVSRTTIEAMCDDAIRRPQGRVASICKERQLRPADPKSACRFFIATEQENALRNLSRQDDIEALCRVAMRDPQGLAAKVCRETGKHPADPEEMCLFLVITRQLDVYEKEDSEFQNLRPAFERADSDLKAKVMEVYRSGDRRLDGFIGTGEERIAGTKKLEDCSDEEIQHFIESRLRHKEWPKLFSAFLRMPLRLGLPLLPRFRDCGWEPEISELRSVFRGALAEINGDSSSRSSMAGLGASTSSIFVRWLQEGRTNPPAASEQELLQRLKASTPPEGVRIVAALAALSSLSESARTAVKDNPHWLVRLAGAATGVTPLGLSSSDGNYWVRELSSVHALMNFWPGKATPADLDALDAAPAEAWVGQFGQSRRLLQLLIANRVGTDTVVDDVEVEIGAEDATFEDAE